MIQRIQTVFISLAFLAAVALFFFPFAGVYSDLHTYKLFIYRFQNMVPGEEPVFSFMTVLPLLLLNILTAGFTLASIFLYKDRIKQIKFVRLGLFTDVVLIGLVFFVYARIVENKLGATPNYLDEAGIYFPLIIMIFLIVANKFIVKDERLVRSVDRLR
jgi:hypothetical protein